MLTEAGWEVVEIAEFDLWHRAAYVKERVVRRVPAR